MRLLFATAEAWPTFRADVAALFGKYLPRCGLQSDLVALGEADAGAAWAAGQAWLYPPGTTALRRHVAGLLHGIRGLLRARAGVHDAIQVRDLPLLAVFALLVARWRGLPFFYWMSYPMPEGHLALARERGLSQGMLRWLFPYLRGKLGRHLLYRLVLPRADHVFVQSERMRQDLAAVGLDPAHMTLVVMGVDFERIAAVGLSPERAERQAGRRLLVYLGTLDRPRRIERLFEMLALVREQEPDTHLLLVGDCGEASHRAALRQAAVDAGVSDHVTWTGWLPTEQGWQQVREAEIGLSPFPRGPLLDSASPTKVGEYLALGVPVVGNDNPDQQEVLANSGGGLCVPYTAAEFAAAVLQLLRLPGANRAAMAKAGAAWVREHRDYAVIASDLAARYEALLCAAARGNGAVSRSSGDRDA